AVDDATAQLIADLEKKELDRLEKQKNLQQFISDYIKQRNDYREYDKKRIAAEDERIHQYQIDKDKRDAENEAALKKKKEEEARKCAQVFDHIDKELKEKEELEMLQEQLDFEENERKAREKDQLEAEKALKTKVQLMEAQEDWRKQKAQQKAKEVEEDKKLKEQMVKTFNEEEVVIKLKELERKEKIALHMREAERLIAIKKEKESLEILHAKQLWEEEQQKIRDRRRAIQEERLRLLKLHAVKLWGYLPKGVIMNEEELQVFPEEMQKEFLASKTMNDKTSTNAAIAQKFFKDDIDNDEYQRLYARDIRRFFPETDLQKQQQQQQDQNNNRPPGLIPGLATGENVKAGPKWRYKSTRPW
ncbi:MAG: hypothetical protein EZS28_036693, partial [Streblomastix strix]